MDAAETRRRVLAARGYAGWTTYPKFAKAIGISDTTLKRYAKRLPTGRRREEFLRTIAREAHLPYEFFTVDLQRLPELAAPAAAADGDRPVSELPAAVFVRLAALERDRERLTKLEHEVSGLVAQSAAEDATTTPVRTSDTGT